MSLVGLTDKSFIESKILLEEKLRVSHQARAGESPTLGLSSLIRKNPGPLKFPPSCEAATLVPSRNEVISIPE